YVIQGLGESRLMTTERTRWIGSVIAGGALGLTIGFLTGELGVVNPRTASLVGAAVGVMTALVIMEVHRRYRATQIVGSS
ncbi:MAG TPA: hypothetical protein VGI75_14505, partial [Pirellulales bacterium]